MNSLVDFFFLCYMSKILDFITRQIVGAFLVIALLSFGCRSVINPVAVVVQSTQAAEKRSPEPTLMPHDSTDEIYRTLNSKQSVIRFYTLMGNRPVWSNCNKLSTLGDSMVSLIKDVRYYGLLPKNYHANEIITDNTTSGSTSHWLRTDALLTDAFLSLITDVEHGRLQYTIDATNDSLSISLLQHVINGYGLQKSLDKQEPHLRGYRFLKAALRFSLDTLDEEYRKPLMQGCVNDSIPLHRKIRSIEINMERWRWENDSLGHRFIFVNMPSFLLQVVEDDTVKLESKVIVGSINKQTPVLSSKIECFVIYPYWHVPRKISVEEYLPKLQRDTTFISRNNFEILDRKGNLLDPDSVDWEKFTKNYFPVVLRQREGPENSLGVIKFVFDNPYAVFLHDTNSKSLFKKNVRALSHGCIRMEKAIALAHYLATGAVEKTSKSVARYLKQEQRHTIDLQNPIPIYVRYFTCEFKDNKFYSYSDIYGLDEDLISRLYR